MDRLGGAGLTCFNSLGEKLWDFQPPSGCDRITDCYALNVSNDGVWAYYYTDFPLVRIDSSGSVKAWQTNTSGGRQFAIHGKHVLLFGGYGESRNDCRLLHLADSDAERVANIKLLLPEHVDLSNAVIKCRNNVLDIFFTDEWYIFSLASLRWQADQT